MDSELGVTPILAERLKQRGMRRNSMLGLWLEDQKVRLRNDLPIPEPPYGEALIKVRLAGICATDLEMVRGYYPFTGIMGHEFVGEVIQSPTKPGLEGQRVVGEINASCGQCQACKAGRPTHCEKRSVLGILNRNGVFAEYLTLPVENLHLLPDSLADEAAVFTEPLAAALEIQEQVHIQPTDRVLVIGAGRLGQLVAQTLALTGCELLVVTRHKDQDHLLGLRGIATCKETEAPAREVDVVVEATGSPQGFALARRAVRPRGTIILKSTYKGELHVNFSAIVVDEITLVGSRCGPFPPAIRLLESGKVDPRPLISGRYPLAETESAIHQAGQPGALKILLKYD
jgi:threonine dehydrogenase-like Zn-dependent dehydrogenase